MAHIKATNNRWTISQLMNKYQYSLRDLEPLTGYSASMLCRLFKGERTIKVKHKQILSKVFQIPEKDIIWPTHK
ncbi:hypothetical protein [uncultured Mediterranean phage uvMED]|jgi:antitoxin component HigA of HigAB toxin-antitoxin module|nr:hypothetical protein [uncultured Mediterranean phage uvMED]